MIDFLRGKVVHKEADYIVLDVRDIGYRVFCANPYLYSTPDGGEVTVYIHHNVREDAILLFGFASREEQSLFRLLLEVSGIGPRVALGILSGANPSAVVTAIQQENIVFLMKLPGIGRKTAQRIILDIKDKLASHSLSTADNASDGIHVGAPSYSPGSNSWLEAKEALMGLGYSETETDRAWMALRSKVQETDPVDQLIKRALQVLFAG